MKAPKRVQIEFPNGISPIHPNRQAAVGVGTSGTPIQQAIDVEQYEEQLKRRTERLLEEDVKMFQQVRQERARMSAEADARLLGVRTQGEKERARYEVQGRMRDGNPTLTSTCEGF